ncbi:MAG: DUF2490 domain-containing protein [Bdellovibrionales bacterium]
MNFRKKINIAALFIATSLLSTALYAEDRQSQYWSSIKLSSAFGEKTTLLGELLNRYSDESDKFTTRSVRLGLKYKFESSMYYAFIVENRTGSSDNSDENRYINEFGYAQNLEKLKIGYRGRLEWREFSNTSAFLNRLRLRVKLDGTGYQFGSMTPFALVEHFQFLNDVLGRPEGSTELRIQAGVSFKAMGGKVSISYLDRTTKTPAFESSPSSESKYGIVDIGLSWKH